MRNYLIEEIGQARGCPIAVASSGLSLNCLAVISKYISSTQPDVYGPFVSGNEGGIASLTGAHTLFVPKLSCHIFTLPWYK